MTEIMEPVQADQMLEESVTLEATDLLYRPIWAFEFAWQGKGKQGIVEIEFGHRPDEAGQGPGT